MKNQFAPQCYQTERPDHVCPPPTQVCRECSSDYYRDHHLTRAWLLAMVFTFLIFVWPAAGSQADDDVAIRALTQKFLTAYDNKDLASVISMCGQKSADLNAIKQVSEQVFASDVRARFGAPGIQKTVVEGSSAAVTVVWNGSGSGSQSSGETPRVWALGLRKDDEGWRVWRFVPTREELAVALVGSKSDQVVAELLRTYKELLTPELLEALNARGDSLYSAGKFAQAIATFDTALEIAKRLLDDKSIPVILRKAGNACFRLGDFDKAIEYYDKSVKLAELLGDKKLVSAALNNMGLIVFNRGQFNQALEILEKSLRIKQEVG
ncbi:MAG TPA: tetratricopeptide repeat protein, partial [Blastocatellia bacterium]|nr:tetratricopeptide repeat protein [Blastocatellia bacterium]